MTTFDKMIRYVGVSLVGDAPLEAFNPMVACVRRDWNRLDDCDMLLRWVPHMVEGKVGYAFTRIFDDETTRVWGLLPGASARGVPGEALDLYELFVRDREDDE